MPFMIGPAPIRRTLQYLQGSNLVLREGVKIFAIHYNTVKGRHEGTEQFAFWHACQLQYKNPDIQLMLIKNLTPSPFLRIFMDDGEDILMDVDGKSRADIRAHVKKILCKSDEQIKLEAKQEQQNPAHFGWGCDRQCICEIPGQVPCPGIVQLPKIMRKKYICGQNEDD